MSKLWMAIMSIILGHIIAWFHMQQKYEGEKVFVDSFGGIPISFCFYYGTRWFYEYFGNYWYVRPIGFGMGTLVFAILTFTLLNETPDIRTIICLVLSVIIIIIQLSHLIIK